MSLVPAELKCEMLAAPLGIDVPQPRLSWWLQGDGTDRAQTAYRLLVASSSEHLARDEGDLWDSGAVVSRDQLLVPYNGAPLASRQRCHWKVMVWDEARRPGAWSEPGVWEMGLLERADWQAQWIELEFWSLKDEPGPSPFVRTAFHLPAGVRRARLYASALGVYEARLNGQRVGDALLAPGWTDYRVRVAYQTYDVTDLVREGDNVLGAMLGDGWYAGYIGFRGERRHYGPRPRFLAQLEIDLANGERVVVGSTGAWNVWRGAFGPLRMSDFLMGETYDAREELQGWDTPGYDAAAWKPVVPVVWPTALVADLAPPVRRLAELPAVTVEARADGTRVFDFGQNMVGWVRATVRGAPGDEIRFRFAEMLDAQGNLYTENLRFARCTDTYTCRGTDEAVFEPHFTFHGFRYVEVTGADLALNDLVGVVIGSDTPWVGTFSCSDADVNRLHSNITWGQRGNFLSVPTDCPQRDERLGWLGDAQVFAPTAALNADVGAFFAKWLRDVRDAQSPAGAFPDVAPRTVTFAEGAPAWGDAGVILPWVLYRHYGDERLLREHWDAMERWMAYIAEANGTFVRRERLNHNYGDWLAQDGEGADAFGSRTPKELVATAYWAHIASLMAHMAAVLHNPEAQARYGRLAQDVRRAFVDTFVEEHGWIRGRTQTGQVLALHFALVPEERAPDVAARLVDLIRAKGGHLTTGFLGVSGLCPVLTRFGYADVAYGLLLKDTFPSWLYSIRQGATTIWERWDGYTHEKGFQTPEMNSFNHYSLGSVGQWLFEGVAGLRLADHGVAFEDVVIAPTLGGRLTYAAAEHRSARGPVRVAWRLDGEQFTLDVTLPPNTRGVVHLPHGLELGPASASSTSSLTLGSGSHRIVAHTKEGVSA